MPERTSPAKKPAIIEWRPRSWKMAAVPTSMKSTVRNSCWNLAFLEKYFSMRGMALYKMSMNVKRKK